jgi:exodeoxyribonuclease-5
MVGEKLLVLRNRRRTGLMNGEIVTVTHVEQEVKVSAHGRRYRRLPLRQDQRADRSAGDGLSNATACRAIVTFGHAITGHKSQGSQWDSVLLFDESACFRDDRWRWLYTAITRAISRITVVR